MEEDDLLRKVGTENPFKVPDGYFEQLTSEIMTKLPEKEKVDFTFKQPTLWDKVKPWCYMAAMFIGAALLIRVGSNSLSSGDKQTIENDQEMEYIYTMADNSMMDDYSLYVCFAEENEEYK